MAGWAQRLAADLVLGPGEQIRADWTTNGAIVDLRAEAASSIQMLMNQRGSFPIISLRRGNGTFAASTAVTANQQLGSLNFRGHDGSAMFDAAEIQVNAGASAWAPSSPGPAEHSTSISIQGVAGTGAKVEWLRLRQTELRFTSSIATFDFLINNTLGLRFGTAATQKMGWWSATPVARVTGWGVPTGTGNRLTFDPLTVTLTVLAGVVKSIVDDLTLYGLIGP